MVEQYPRDEILDENERIVKGWASVEIVDTDGEIIPISELKKVMPVLMERGGFITDRHSNRIVGKILNYEFKKHPITGKDGLLITYKIFDNYEIDDKIWEEIKKGKRKGLSLGGKYKRKFEKNGAVVLKDIELLEISTVEEPANPYAVNVAVNMLAKGDIEKYIRRRGNKWVVVSHSGEVLGEHDTYNDALRQLKAIEANKKIEKYLSDFKKPDDLRPPKEWWNRCMEELGNERLCAWVYWHHLEPKNPEGEPDPKWRQEARERKRKWLAEVSKELGYDNKLPTLFDLIDEINKNTKKNEANMPEEIETTQAVEEKHEAEEVKLLRQLIDEIKALKDAIKPKEEPQEESKEALTEETKEEIDVNKIKEEVKKELIEEFKKNAVVVETDRPDIEGDMAVKIGDELELAYRIAKGDIAMTIGEAMRWELQGKPKDFEFRKFEPPFYVVSYLRRGDEA